MNHLHYECPEALRKVFGDYKAAPHVAGLAIRDTGSTFSHILSILHRGTTITVLLIASNIAGRILYTVIHANADLTEQNTFRMTLFQ